MIAVGFANDRPVEPAMGISRNAATISPSPGGEGRGEDGRFTNIVFEVSCELNGTED